MRELGVPACSGAFRGVQVVFRFVPVCSGSVLVMFWWCSGISSVPFFEENRGYV